MIGPARDSLASALHRAAMRAYPAAFRARLGDDLHETFAHRTHHARVRGRLPWIGTIVSGILDTIASGIAERAADRRARAHSPFHASSSIRSLPMTWESIVSDTRQALRHVRRAPTLAAMVVITLAIGIGANSAIFGAVYAALIKPLPYAEAGDLVAVWSHHTKLADENYPVSPANFDAFARESSSFTQVEAMYSFLTNAQVALGDSSETLQASWVTPGMFRMLGRQALIGRGLQEGDETSVVLSHDYWQRRFGGDRGVIGQRLPRMAGAPPLTIVGVMDPAFVFPYRSMLGPSGFSRVQRADIWLQLTPATGFRMVDNAGQPSRTIHMLSIVARLKPGVSLSQARADLQSIADRRARDLPDTNEGFAITMRPLLDQTVGSIRPALMLLSTGVGLLLLLTCINIANVLLARASSRQRDGAVRAALGASRARLLQQSLVESLVLSLLGGAAALVVVAVGSSALLALAPSDLPRIAETRLSPVVIAVTFFTALLTGLLTGLMPAIAASRVRPEEGLRESKRTTATKRQRLLRSSLVIAEVTLATVLTIGAGLLLRSFTAVLNVDPGFAPDHLLTFQVNVPPRHVSPASQIGFYDELRDKIMAIPGVTHVGGSTRIPLGSTLVSSMLTVEHRDVPPADLPEVQMRRAVLDFFGAMRIPVLDGRVFNDTDRPRPVPPATAPAAAAAQPASSRPAPEGVAVVNAALAARIFPNEQVVGRRVRLGSNPNSLWLRIIGVVGNVQHSNLEEELLPEIYISHFQGPPTGPFMAVRTAGDPAAVITGVRAAVASLKADPPSNVKTMEELRQESVGERRFVLWLTGVFGLVAVLLAGVGIYGVIALVVSERTAEVGVRLALGATPRQVWSMLVSQAATLGAIGVTLGAAAAFVLTPLAAALLFGVSPADPWTFGGVSLLLVLIAVLAAAVPARRAMRVDPASALR